MFLLVQSAWQGCIVNLLANTHPACRQLENMQQFLVPYSEVLEQTDDVRKLCDALGQARDVMQRYMARRHYMPGREAREQVRSQLLQR